MRTARALSGNHLVAAAAAAGALVLALGACAPTNQRCDVEERVGTFEIVLADGYTAVQGQVSDGADLNRVPVEVAVEGSCHLVRPPNYVCEPRCDPGLTCGPDGDCRPMPANVSVGAVTVSGLAANVRMTADPPVYFYTARGELPHPAVEEGAPIELRADGREGASFALQATGIAPLEVESGSIPVESGRSTAVRWIGAAKTDLTRVDVELNIANHGGTPAWITCASDDDGSIDIPASLIQQLLDLGYSGFPTVSVTRYTSDAVQTPSGCVELVVRSTVQTDVSIQGLVSCNRDGDCPTGTTCRSDLTCK